MAPLAPGRLKERCRVKWESCHPLRVEKIRRCTWYSGKHYQNSFIVIQNVSKVVFGQTLSNHPGLDFHAVSMHASVLAPSKWSLGLLSLCVSAVRLTFFFLLYASCTSCAVVIWSTENCNGFFSPHQVFSKQKQKQKRLVCELHKANICCHNLVTGIKSDFWVSEFNIVLIWECSG